MKIKQNRIEEKTSFVVANRLRFWNKLNQIFLRPWQEHSLNFFGSLIHMDLSKQLNEKK